MKNLIKSSILIIVFLLLGLGISNSLGGQNIDFTKAAEHTVHAVVHIECEYSQQTNFYEDFFGFLIPQQRSRTYQTSGSGVIIEKNGYVVTNNHVVQDADRIKVTLNDKREYEAKIIGNDASADIAIIKIDANNLPTIEFGDSDNTKIGQWVLAVGNPFNLTSTVTAGIISAKARNLNILGNKMNDNPLKSFIQTDAAVNPGNSGGALVDLEGKLIGINTAIASNTGSYAGYSFAIPSNIVRKISSDIIKYGITQNAYLGANIAEIDSRLAKNKGIKKLNGVYIVSVHKNGTLEKAKLMEGDIILKLGKRAINYNSELNEVLAQSSPGDKIRVKYDRNGKISEKNLVLLNERGDTSIIKIEKKPTYNILNAEIRELSSREKKEYGINNGYMIEKLNNSAFARLGLKKNFIITSLDKDPGIGEEDIKMLNLRKGKVIIEGFYPGDYRKHYFMLVL